MLDKIGYVILLFIYTFGFSVGKNIFDESGLSSKLESSTNESIVRSIANDLMETTGMNSFFDELRRGL